jgi:hypothetical protein
VRPLCTCPSWRPRVRGYESDPKPFQPILTCTSSWPRFLVSDDIRRSPATAEFFAERICYLSDDADGGGVRVMQRLNWPAFTFWSIYLAVIVVLAWWVV